ncbi:SDR family NAD(P)-dependent oxidoreductase [Pacificoceanicola onchidii]|uniref:SDR family NAD(P)-dependent oxidoreductase n=1 Tax=Pacificoceanicola onchidii TaxID=2562685 RepID=UPI0010A5FAE8|nr:SDR family NAD(P)-dependent oxidoreductase [Pacificoceanicola onchidii]
MERALIIGSSGGLGSAISAQLNANGVNVTGLSRRSHGFDITNESLVETHLNALNGPLDLVFVATGALEIEGAQPEKSLSALDPKAMADQYLLNAIGPMLVLKHAVRLLPKDRPAVFAALSARVGSIGDNRLGGWYSYRAAKAGLNQLMHGAAIELARSHKHLACVCLHPGTVRTAFTQKYLGRHPSVPAPEAAERLVSVIEGLTPAQTGGFFDYAGKEIVW